MWSLRRLRFEIARAVGVACGLVLCGLGHAAAQPTPTVFACDAPGRRTCFFTVFTAAGRQSFSLAWGQRRVVTGLTPQRDVYLVSYGAPNLGDEGRCRQMAALSRGCDRKMVDPDYND